ncbi:MAG TPA: hypothetical protein VM536_18480, partial [Chloroflexia bacterium]|nr:hypothetical protein [Chloroflexia bacterium]
MATPSAPVALPFNRREAGWAVLLSGLLAALFLGPALLPGRVLSPADLLFNWAPWAGLAPPGWKGAANPLLVDSILTFEPWLIYTATRLHAGSFPLWNPDNMLGAPFLGNMQSAIFYPLNWPAFLWPGGAVLVLRAWLKLVIAGVGMYGLARTVFRVGPLPAALAAITFSLGAFQVVWLLHSLTNAAILLPSLWWATARLIEQPGPRRGAALALLVAVTLVAGHPETAYHMALATGLFAVVWTAETRRRRGADREPKSHGAVGRSWVVPLGAAAGAYVLGVLLAAIQLVPFAEYLGQSVAISARSDPNWEGFWLPGRFAWTMLTPDLFGNPAHGDWWAPGIIYNYNETNSYSGILPLLLAPLALGLRDRCQRRLALFLAAVGVLAAAVAYHVPGIYQAAVQLTFLRTAANHRLVLVVQFALALLGALGADALLREPARRRLAVILAGTVAVGLIAGLGIPLLAAEPYFLLPSG